MATILQQIEVYKRREIAARKAMRPYAEVVKAAEAAGPVRGFKASLERAIAATGYD